MGFLAHAGKDRAVCEQLFSAFEKAGASVYLDTRMLDGAAEWDRELPSAQRLRSRAWRPL